MIEIRYSPSSNVPIALTSPPPPVRVARARLLGEAAYFFQHATEAVAYFSPFQPQEFTQWAHE